MASAALVVCLIVAAGIHSAEGIRRHHRHRRDPDPVGEERVQEQNKYKPKFEDCETYDPTVEEGSRKGKSSRRLFLSSPSGAASGDSTPLQGSFFCCTTTTSRVKTSAAPEITLEVVTWNRVPESAAHFQFGFEARLFSFP